MLTAGFPSAAAMCIAPESFVTTTAARRISATTSPSVVFPVKSADPGARAETHIYADI